MTYAEDSFFTLSIAGQIGLVFLSLVLTGALLALGWLVMRGRPLAVNIPVAIVLFALFVWLSPQLYFQYYRLIISGLPAQWVIGLPPFNDIAAAAGFTGRATLSAHGQGLLFWALVAQAIVASRRGARRR